MGKEERVARKLCLKNAWKKRTWTHVDGVRTILVRFFVKKYFCKCVLGKGWDIFLPKIYEAMPVERK